MRITLAEPSPARLERMAEQLRHTDLTYGEVGATGHPDSLPSGYRHTRRSVVVGGDRGAFALGRDALLGWHAHRAIGARLFPDQPPLVEGQVVIATVPLGPLRAVVPCRIVAVTDEEQRFGFAYGTLPGHPEQGEESFHVVASGDGQVRFEIVAFSRPASWLVRLAGPVGRREQQRATEGYLTGVRSYVERRS